MEMDCLAYGRMIEEIQQENVRRGVPYNSEDDYKYHYRKEDKLEPIMTLTLYWGKKKVERTCFHMRSIPEKDLARMDSDLKYVIGLLECSDHAVGTI